jgi:hypothetical protein
MSMLLRVEASFSAARDPTSGGHPGRGRRSVWAPGPARWYRTSGALSRPSGVHALDRAVGRQGEAQRH